MCLAIPGKIISQEERENLKMAKVSFGGAIREVCLDLVPEAKDGDYVIVHVGYALNIIDDNEAVETLKLFEELEACG
ncbi:MAG: HypC/HybG/HupF family hydrogenase formation chaperone [Candidatus Kapabacteria bacterium]|nr:HypC/HybG/HupF family hydrogenase formation chaperone [Candidatus Kapabacteria bacterium]